VSDDPFSRLVQELEFCIADRDEARREVCKLKSFNFEGKITPEGYAELRKWDCFKTASTEKS
jgi:hypothetical protein